MHPWSYAISLPSCAAGAAPVDCTDEEHWETTERFFVEDSGIGALSVVEVEEDNHTKRKIIKLNAALVSR